MRNFEFKYDLFRKYSSLWTPIEDIIHSEQAEDLRIQTELDQSSDRKTLSFDTASKKREITTSSGLYESSKEGTEERVDGVDLEGMEILITEDMIEGLNIDQD